MYTAYAYYVIWFSNLTEYNAAIALYGGNGFGACPVTAAATFGITWPLTGEGPMTATKGMYGTLPWGIPASPGAGLEIGHPLASGVFIKSDVDSVIVPGQNGNPAQTPGQDMNLVWWGNILYAPNQVSPGVAPTTNIPERRWIQGFENSNNQNSETITTGTRDGVSRVGSRTVDGSGYVLRGTSAPQTAFKLTDSWRVGLAPVTSWERFYFRIDNLGSNELTIWRCQAHTATTAGATIRISTTGRLLVYSGVAVTGGTLLGTGAILTVGKWYLLDLLLKYNAAAGTFRVYLNHTLYLNCSDTTATGLNINDHHQSSTLGQQTASEASWELDIDDWMCADVPNIAGVESLTSIDWLSGTHIREHKIETAVLTNWAGTKEGLNGQYAPVTNTSLAVTSNTALSTLEGTVTSVTNDEGGVAPGAILGPVSVYPQANLFSSQAAPSVGRIGYSLNGGAYVYINATFTQSYNWAGSYYKQTGQPLPVDIALFKTILEHANDASLYTLSAFNILVEYVGVWGKEDDINFPLDVSNNLYFHNGRYANTHYGLFPFAGVPTAPVFAVGGTYAGNSTGQSINLPAPASFIFIRPLTGSGASGVWFHSSGISGHKGGQSNCFADVMTRVWVDSTGQAKFSVNGAGPDINLTGVTYQYVAFCDPGMRFMYNDAYNIRGAATTKTFSLFDTAFLPEAGFTQKETYGSVDATVYLRYKGAGSIGNTGYTMAGAALANWGSWAAGSLTLLANNIDVWNNQRNYALWKSTDYNGYTALQITSYIGDGLAFKNVNLPKVTGRYPLMVLVIPHNTTPSYIRDPSHTGVTSSNFSSLNSSSSTAIMGAGPDMITVGITLNANAVVYEVFVILGGATWINGTFGPPSSPAVGPWINPTYVPLIPPGGVKFNGSPTILALKNISGIYTLVPDKLTDTVYDGLPLGSSLEVEIPEPSFKTGYIGG